MQGPTAAGRSGSERRLVQRKVQRDPPRDGDDRRGRGQAQGEVAEYLQSGERCNWIGALGAGTGKELWIGGYPFVQLVHVYPVYL